MPTLGSALAIQSCARRSGQVINVELLPLLRPAYLDRSRPRIPRSAET